MDCLNNIQFYEEIKNYTNKCFDLTCKKDDIVIFDEKLNTFLEKIDDHYSRELSPVKKICLEYLANVIEKIQFLCWLLALKKYNFTFSMSKKFLRSSTTGIFRLQHQQDSIFFDQHFSETISTYITKWENIMLTLALHIFQDNSFTDIQILLFHNRKFRAVIIGCYFTYKLCTM